MMISSSRNLRQNPRIPLMRIGKLSTKNHPQKTTVTAARIVLPIPTMVTPMPTVADTGKLPILPSEYLHRFPLISSSKPTTNTGATDGDAQKRFSNAKSISSDQFFNKDSDVRM